MRSEYGRQSVTSVETLIRSTRVKLGDIDPDELDVLAATDGIDEGEAILFAATKAHAEFVVVSDDKNSLRALAEDPECQVIFDRMCGHVICLEDLLLRIMAQHDYEQVRRKLFIVRHCVSALSQTLGLNEQAPQM